MKTMAETTWPQKYEPASARARDCRERHTGPSASSKVV